MSGALIDYALLLPTEERCVDRVATRTDHAFTDLDAARHLHRQFAGAVVDGRHVLADTELVPDALAARIELLAAGGSLGYTVLK